jgi:hypothetical protein
LYKEFPAQSYLTIIFKEYYNTKRLIALKVEEDVIYAVIRHIFQYNL